MASTIERTYWRLPPAAKPTEEVLLYQCPKFNASNLDGVEATNAFAKDWDRLKEVLHYDGKSIGERYAEGFRPLDAIERIRRMLPADAENQTENLSHGFEITKSALGERVVADLSNYLDSTLGPYRTGLKTEILWRFSQKALTQIVAIGLSELQKRFKGSFPPKFNEKLMGSIELVIPTEGQGPVKVVAKTQCIYNRFIPNGIYEATEITPIHFEGEVTYTIQYKKGWLGRTNVAESVASGTIKFFRPLSKAAGEA